MILLFNRKLRFAGGIWLAVMRLNEEAECCEEHVIHTDAVTHARIAMPSEEITSAASDFFKAFSSAYFNCAGDRRTVCLRYCFSIRNEPICNLPSTSFFETSTSCKKQKKRQNRVLCALR